MEYGVAYICVYTTVDSTAHNWFKRKGSVSFSDVTIKSNANVEEKAKDLTNHLIINISCLFCTEIFSLQNYTF